MAWVSIFEDKRHIKAKEDSRIYRETHKEILKIKRSSTKEEKREYNRQYRSINKDRVHAAHKRWLKEHPDYVKKNNTRKKIELRSICSDYIIETGGKCKLCGFVYDKTNFYFFDFHHRDPNIKDSAISSIKKKELLKIELQKCDVLCVKCHRELHYGAYVDERYK